jgi:hypothetical protein
MVYITSILFCGNSWCPIFVIVYLSFFDSLVDIFPLMCATYKVWITELTLIPEKYQSVWLQTYYNITDKNSSISFEGIDRHITSITTRSIGIAEILVLMSVSTFKPVVILYIQFPVIGIILYSFMLCVIH